MDTSKNFLTFVYQFTNKKITMKNIETTNMMLSTYDSTLIYPHGYMSHIDSALKFAKTLTELVNKFAEVVGVDGENVTFEIPQTGPYRHQLVLKAIVPNDWEPLEGVIVHGQYRTKIAPTTSDLIKDGRIYSFTGVDLSLFPPANPHNLFGTIIP